MGESRQILTIIPARGGSKGIPRKNLQPFAGKPLIVHTIEAIINCDQLTRIIVSTEDTEIAEVANRYGAEVVFRPLEIASDTATSESALLHTLEYLQQTENYQPDLVVFLQCTCPIRQPTDIDGAIKTLEQQQADSLLSVTASHRFLWREKEGQYYSINYDYRKRPRRQDCPPEYIENGSIYVFKPWVLQQLNNRLGGKIAIYKMDYWSSFDIDSWDDFKLCEWIYQQKINHKPR